MERRKTGQRDSRTTGQQVSRTAEGSTAGHLDIRRARQQDSMTVRTAGQL